MNSENNIKVNQNSNTLTTQKHKRNVAAFPYFDHFDVLVIVCVSLFCSLFLCFGENESVFYFLYMVRINEVFHEFAFFPWNLIKGRNFYIICFKNSN